MVESQRWPRHEAMQACFPSGDALSMFNRNGFNYFGVDELTKVWEHYAKGHRG